MRAGLEAMGHASNQRNILLCLTPLDDALGRAKAPVKRGVAVDAANKAFAG